MTRPSADQTSQNGREHFRDKGDPFLNRALRADERQGGRIYDAESIQSEQTRTGCTARRAVQQALEELGRAQLDVRAAGHPLSSGFAGSAVICNSAQW